MYTDLHLIPRQHNPPFPSDLGWTGSHLLPTSYMLPLHLTAAAFDVLPSPITRPYPGKQPVPSYLPPSLDMLSGDSIYWQQAVATSVLFSGQDGGA